MSSPQTEHSNLFIQMVNLKYRHFIQMIQELNGIIPFFYFIQFDYFYFFIETKRTRSIFY